MFCEVILPLHLPRTFTYRIPTDLQGQVKIGCRVAVQFGNKRIYSALVAELHNRVPRVQSVKFILELIDREAVISQENLSFWQWIADYYACYIGDVMLAGLLDTLHTKYPDFTYTEVSVIENPGGHFYLFTDGTRADRLGHYIEAN